MGGVKHQGGKTVRLSSLRQLDQEHHLSEFQRGLYDQQSNMLDILFNILFYMLGSGSTSVSRFTITVIPSMSSTVTGIPI